MSKKDLVIELVQDQNIESKKAAKCLIMEMKEDYEKNRYKKWFVAVFGLLFGLVVGISIP